MMVVGCLCRSWEVMVVGCLYRSWEVMVVGCLYRSMGGDGSWLSVQVNGRRGDN